MEEKTDVQNTKDRIVTAALALFSEKGYGAVSVRDIAGKAGLRESSLYYHFKNKQDIFDTIVQYCFKKAEEYFRTHSLPFAEGDDLSMYQGVELSRLEELLFSTFGYFFDDPWNVQFRKLLLVNQYENEEAKKIYRSLYRDYPLRFQSKLFAALMELGEFKKADPKTTAMEFYGPVFLLFHTCDSLEEAREAFEKHIRQFASLYRIPAKKQMKHQMEREEQTEEIRIEKTTERGKYGEGKL
ncbi:MAG: TetR/AcrR family transcriptional regulator [Lachnospiraceae bacterium]|nr:TetR/AcrR family transcriptional regulator [Lachnospiraceae bacterium]